MIHNVIQDKYSRQEAKMIVKNRALFFHREISPFNRHKTPDPLLQLTIKVTFIIILFIPK